MISSSQRPLPDNTRQSQQTNIHAPRRAETFYLPLKIRRLRPGLNPGTSVPKASTLPLDHRSRYSVQMRYGSLALTARLAVIYMAPTDLNRLVLADRHKLVSPIQSYAECLFKSLSPSVYARVKKKKNWRTTQRIFIKFGTGKFCKKNSSHMISGFRRGLNEFFILLGCYAA